MTPLIDTGARDVTMMHPTLFRLRFRPADAPARRRRVVPSIRALHAVQHRIVDMQRRVEVSTCAGRTRRSGATVPPPGGRPPDGGIAELNRPVRPAGRGRPAAAR